MKKLIITILIACLLSSCGTTKPVATVGDIDIPKGEVAFYLSQIKDYMKGTELQTEEDWENKEIEGKKAIDLARERAVDMAIEIARFIEIGKLAGISLDDNDKAMIEESKKRVITNYGGESEYKKFLKENNITERVVEISLESSVYESKIRQKIVAEQPAGQEEGKKFFEENSGEFRKAKHILIMTIDDATQMPKTEEEVQTARALADELLKRAKAGEDFDALMNEYSEDPGLEANPDGYVFGTGEMVPEFEQATDSVAAGEIAFCESSYGYHIIKRLPVDYADVEDRIVSMIVDERMEEQMALWEEEYALKIVKNEDVLSEIK